MTPVTEAGASQVAALFIALAIKSTAVLFGSLIVAWTLRRRSAAARHASWTIAVMAWLAIPIVELVAPPLTAHVPGGLASYLPAAPRLGGFGVPPSELTRTSSERPPESSIRKPVEEAPPATVSTGEPSPEEIAHEEIAHQDETVSSGDAASAMMPPGKPQVPVSASWSLLGLGIWIGGSIGVAGFFTTGWVMLAAIQRRARRVDDPAWLALLEEARRRLGIRRPVRLLMGDDTMVPITWGTLHPAILLPSSASQWSDGHRLAILTHELAHVRRLDCAIQDAAHLACALYWWHPGVWYVAQRLRNERESACDDVVLSAGAGATEYAGQLVEVVRAGRRPGLALAMSSASMAQRSDLERRVRAILDDAVDRRSVSMRRVLWAGGVAAALILPLGALELTASAVREPQAPIEPVASEKAQPEEAGKKMVEAAAEAEPGSKAAEAAPASPMAPTVPGKMLSERWEKAVADKRNSGAFWVVYSIEYDGGPDGRNVLITDSGHFDWSELDADREGPSLAERFGIPASDAVLMFHYPGHGKEFDRVAMRTAKLKPHLRGKPVQWLGRIPYDESFSTLAQRFKRMPDDAKAAAVVKAISLHQTAGVEPMLEDVLASKRSDEVRSNAAEGLTDHPGREALDALETAAYKDRSIEVRAEAAESIGEMRYEPATDVIIKLAHDASPERVRSEAVESLAEREPARVVKELESIAFEDPSEEVKMEATETLGDLPGTVGWPALRRIAANHPKTSVREEAFETLGEKARPESGSKDEGSKEEGSKKHKSKNRESSSGAIDSEMKRFRTTDDVDALEASDHFENVSQLRKLALEHPNPELRSAALQVLSHKEPQQALLVLYRAATKDPDESVRVEAIESMGELEGGAGISMLEDLANNGQDEATRTEALETLVEKAPDRALVLVDRWIKEKNARKKS